MKFKLFLFDNATVKGFFKLGRSSFIENTERHSHGWSFHKRIKIGKEGLQLPWGQKELPPLNSVDDGLNKRSEKSNLILRGDNSWQIVGGDDERILSGKL